MYKNQHTLENIKNKTRSQRRRTVSHVETCAWELLSALKAQERCKGVGGEVGSGVRKECDANDLENIRLII